MLEQASNVVGTRAPRGKVYLRGKIYLQGRVNRLGLPGNFRKKKRT